MIKHLKWLPVMAVALCALQAPAMTNSSGRAAADLGNEWTKWFAPNMVAKPLSEAPFPVCAVVTASGQVNGWIFRTDRIPPVVRGKRGEIGVLVGVGTDGRIKGISVIQQQEDAAWFNRLKAGFYAQFNGHPADSREPRVDTVATATISSKAIVDDVFKSCAAVLALPAVQSQMHPTPK